MLLGGQILSAISVHTRSKGTLLVSDLIVIRLHFNDKHDFARVHTIHDSCPFCKIKCFNDDDLTSWIFRLLLMQSSRHFSFSTHCQMCFHEIRNFYNII